jgi:hypothetical protein
VANKFLSFLSHIGQQFKKGLDAVLPFAQAASVGVAVVNPGIGAALQTTIGVISQTEQKFAAMGQQSGTGSQKLAEATQVLEPALLQIFSANGMQADTTHVQGYINAVVAMLNALPAPVSK